MIDIKGSVVVYENKSLPGNIDIGNEKSIMSLAMKTTAQAKLLAPVDRGPLRNSIMWKMKRNEGGFNDSGKEPASRKIRVTLIDNHEAYIGSNIKYAVYQEFGTRRIPPHPYLRPAIAKVVLGKGKEEIKDIMTKEMEMGKLVMGQVRESFF
jgi:HK97 gp10 family phage protein